VITYMHTYTHTHLLLQSVEKLERSLEIFPDNHNALVVLGSAINATGTVHVRVVERFVTFSCTTLP
jgi:hypothetical protein